MIDTGSVLFLCDECPLCEDLEYRLELADKGYDLQLEYCWCDKVGGKFYAYGYCPDGVTVTVGLSITGGFSIRAGGI